MVADKLERMFQVPPVNLSQDFVAGITLSVTTWTGNYCQVPPPAGARDPRMTTPLEQLLVSGPLRLYFLYFMYFLCYSTLLKLDTNMSIEFGFLKCINGSI